MTASEYIKQRNFRFPVPPRAGGSVLLFRLGDEVWRPGTAQVRTHPVNEKLLVVTSGRARFVSGLRETTLRAGEAGLLRPGRPTRVEALGQPLALRLVVIAGAGGAAWVRSVLGLDEGVTPLRRPGHVHEAMDRLFAEAAGDDPYRHDACLLHVRLVLLRIAADRLGAGDEAPPSGAMETFALCRRCIDEHFSTLSTVEEAARACRIDPAYLSRLFRRFAGMTPRTYLERRKMARAMEYLLDTGLQVGAIAERLGYDTPYAFSRAFKRAVGVAPRAYRQGARSE